MPLPKGNLPPIRKVLANVRSALPVCVEVWGINRAQPGKISIGIDGIGWFPIFPFEHDNAVLMLRPDWSDFVYWERREDLGWDIVDPPEEVWTMIDAELVLYRMSNAP